MNRQYSSLLTAGFLLAMFPAQSVVGAEGNKPANEPAQVEIEARFVAFPKSQVDALMSGKIMARPILTLPAASNR